MTDKQTKTLLLFAQYYSLKEIAHTLKICIGTVKSRLNTIQRLYPNYYANALGMRESIKRAKKNLENPLRCDYLDEIIDSKSTLDSLFKRMDVDFFI